MLASFINMGLDFLLELCTLAAAAYWGFQTGANLPMKLVLGIGAPLLIALIRGCFMAPNAPPYLIGTNNLMKTIIYGAVAGVFGLSSNHYLMKIIGLGAATIALVAAAQPALAIILIIAAAINSVVYRVIALTYKGDWV